MITQLRKALQATTGTGAQLVPEDLERVIRGVLMNLSPLTRMVPMVTADGHIHKIVRRTALPTARFEGEKPSPNYTSSTYDRRSVEVKIVRTYNQVTNFLVSATRSFTDVVADELEASVMAMADLLEFGTIYGVADDLDFTGDAKMYSGVYPFLLTDASASNVIDVDGTITLANLDSALNAAKKGKKDTLNDPYIFLASNNMIDKISGLQTRIQRQAPSVDFEGGFIMTTYQGVPILPTSFVSPESSTTSPTASATGGTAGVIADDTYYYRIASITTTGEQIAGVTSSGVVLNGGTNGSAALSWTADANALLYAIYRSDVSNSDDDDYDLLDIIPALTYANDVPTGYKTTYTDDGSLTAKTTVHPLGTSEEVIFLVNLNPVRGMSRVMLNPSSGDPVDAILQYESITENTSTRQWALFSYHAMQVPRGGVHSVIRRATY